MRKHKNLIFIALVILLLVSLTAIKHYLVVLNRNFVVNLTENETIILGDSHARHALNPQYLTNSINYSQDSQNLIYSHFVLKKLVTEDSKINKVILTYSYHSLGEYYITLESAEMMRRYHLLLDKDYYASLSKYGYLDEIMCIRYLSDFINLPIGISNDYLEYTEFYQSDSINIPYLGSFEQNPYSKLKSPLTLKMNSRIDTKTRQRIKRNQGYLANTIKRHFKNQAGSIPSPLITNYMYKTADLCYQRGIKLYLVNTPLHKEYRHRIPKEIKQSVDALAFDLMNKYDVIYLDYSEFPLSEKYFYDYDHLTTPGSVVFSKYLNDRIIALSKQ